MSEHKAVFEGAVQIRPLGRGVRLGPDSEDFEDWIFRVLGIEWDQWRSGTTVQARITVERLPATTTAPQEGE